VISTLELRKARVAATRTAGVEYRGVPFAGTEIRSVPNGTGGSRLELTGYASVTEAPYELSDGYGRFTETIARGAFTDLKSADVQLKFDHAGVSMARTRSGTMKLAEDKTGLHVEARIDPKRPDVKILRSAVQSKDVDEWSFAFRVSPDGDEWNDTGTVRRITALSMHGGDVSVCNHGANPFTGGLIDLRNRDQAQILRRLAGGPARPSNFSYHQALTKNGSQSNLTLAEAKAMLLERKTRSAERDFAYWQARAQALRLRANK
jgi:HK97 family phage prohead protease